MMDTRAGPGCQLSGNFNPDGGAVRGHPPTRAPRVLCPSFLEAHQSSESSIGNETMFLRRTVGAVHRCGSSAARSSGIQHRHPHRPFSASSSPRAEIEITVDGKKVRIEQGAALIQACELAGVQIPRLKPLDYAC